MTWTHGVLEAFENGATNIFKNHVHVSDVENAMAKGTTIGVAVVVETRDRKGMMQAQAIKRVAIKVVAIQVVVNKAGATTTVVLLVVTQATKAVDIAVVAIMALVVVVVTQATNAGAIAVVEYQCLTN